MKQKKKATTKKKAGKKTTPARNNGKHPGGRPSKYLPEYVEQGRKLCLLGAINKDLADFFGVSESTLNQWKVDHPEFAESLKDAKNELDARVVRSLYERATGYSHPEDKIFNNNGQEMVVATTKHYPPDTTAAIFWLKNRQPNEWRDKQEHEHSGKDGKPIEIDNTHDLGRRLAFALEQAANAD